MHLSSLDGETGAPRRFRESDLLDTATSAKLNNSTKLSSSPPHLVQRFGARDSAANDDRHILRRRQDQLLFVMYGRCKHGAEVSESEPKLLIDQARQP